MVKVTGNSFWNCHDITNRIFCDFYKSFKRTSICRCRIVFDIHIERSAKFSILFSKKSANPVASSLSLTDAGSGFSACKTQSFFTTVNIFFGSLLHCSICSLVQRLFECLSFILYIRPTEYCSRPTEYCSTDTVITLTLLLDSATVYSIV